MKTTSFLTVAFLIYTAMAYPNTSTTQTDDVQKRSEFECTGGCNQLYTQAFTFTECLENHPGKIAYCKEEMMKRFVKIKECLDACKQQSNP